MEGRRKGKKGEEGKQEIYIDIQILWNNKT